MQTSFLESEIALKITENIEKQIAHDATFISSATKEKENASSNAGAKSFKAMKRSVKRD